MFFRPSLFRRQHFLIIYPIIQLSTEVRIDLFILCFNFFIWNKWKKAHMMMQVKFKCLNITQWCAGIMQNVGICFSNIRCSTLFKNQNTEDFRQWTKKISKRLDLCIYMNIYTHIFIYIYIYIYIYLYIFICTYIDTSKVAWLNLFIINFYVISYNK